MNDDFGHLNMGAEYVKSRGTNFRVWAPRADHVEVLKVSSGKEKSFELHAEPRGYFSAKELPFKPGDRYVYVLNKDKKRPDPVSRYQPKGVHGPSEVIDTGAYAWKDSKWKGIRTEDAVIYELHIGTFTPSGTFKEALKKVPYLKKLGITLVELMPIGQFPGVRNWGYDGVQLFAPQNSYGTPDDLKALVDAFHLNGIAVCLDVVYNHLGPEGNYLHDYGPYFTNRYSTPWGDAVNFDDIECDPVRHFFISNALYWIREFHMDALRLDAIHSIFDSSARHILAEMSDAVARCARKLKRKVTLIAESDLNDTKVISPITERGYGMHAQWADDYHHAVHGVLTDETRGYYSDYTGVTDVAKALDSNFVYDGIYSEFRKRKFGNDASLYHAKHFIFHLQNHDQIGNRAVGDRLSTQISFDAQKASAALLLTGPQIPMLFMGQEYGETRPFQYFIDHSDEGLIRGVREGRKHEFKSFGWTNLPDPMAKSTFQASKLDWEKAKEREASKLFLLYQDLIGLRKKWKPLRTEELSANCSADDDQNCLVLNYKASAGRQVAVLVNFDEEENEIEFSFTRSKFREIIRTDDERYGGSRKHAQCSNHYRKGVVLPPQTAIVGLVS